MLKMIYCNIKKHTDSSTDPNSVSYSKLFIDFLEGIESTIFAQPAFFKKRITLFEMISIIWLEDGMPQDAYNFYNRIKKTLDSVMHFDNFYKYAYDVSGLIGALNSNRIFTVLFDLVINDLPSVLIIYFNHINQGGKMVQDAARKALIRLF
jgi:hypothetical protein